MYCSDCDIDELTDRILAALVDAEETTDDPRDVIHDTLLWSGESDGCDL